VHGARECENGPIGHVKEKDSQKSKQIVNTEMSPRDIDGQARGKDTRGKDTRGKYQKPRCELVLVACSLHTRSRTFILSGFSPGFGLGAANAANAEKSAYFVQSQHADGDQLTVTQWAI
jgi:hypothetical protein